MASRRRRRNSVTVGGSVLAPTIIDIDPNNITQWSGSTLIQVLGYGFNPADIEVKIGNETATADDLAIYNLPVPEYLSAEWYT